VRRDRLGTTPLDEAENYKGEATLKDSILRICDPHPEKKWVIAIEKLEVLKRQVEEECAALPPHTPSPRFISLLLSTESKG
jgi:hypothetical protein